MAKFNTEINTGYDYEFGAAEGVMLNAGHFITNEELSLAILEKIKTCMTAPEDFYFTVAGARLYNRKGYKSFDALASERNGSYGSDSDDVVLQVSIRLYDHEARDIIDHAEYIKEEERREALELRKIELAEQKEVLKAQQEAIEAELSKLS